MAAATPQICLTQSTAHVGDCTFLQVPQSKPITFRCNISSCSNSYTVFFIPRLTPNEANQHTQLNNKIAVFLSNHPKIDTTFYEKVKDNETRAFTAYRANISSIATTINNLSIADVTSLIDNLTTLGFFSRDLQTQLSTKVNSGNRDPLLVALMNTLQKDPTAIVDLLSAFGSSHSLKLKQETQTMLQTMEDFELPANQQ